MRNRVGHFMPESLLESQLAALEEPDSSEALVVDVSHPVATVVGSIITSLRLGSSTGIGVEAKAAVTTKRMESGLKPGRR
jgi:hypothetical protein